MSATMRVEETTIGSGQRDASLPPSGDFVLFEDNDNQRRTHSNIHSNTLVHNNIHNSPPFVFDEDVFGLYDAHGIHRRQYSTVTLSTSDGITVLRGGENSSSSAHSPSLEQPYQDQPSQENYSIYKWSSNAAGRFLNNLWFKRILLALIIAQSILVAISTTSHVTTNEELSNMFWSARQVLLSLFTVELVLRLIRYRLHIFKSGWLMWDILVIVGSWMVPQLLILRTFRVLRSLRHATRFQPIREITVALGNTCLPQLIPVLYFLAIIYYIFAVIFTTSYKDELEEFRRLDITLFTLFQVMTLDDWSDLARRAMEDHTWAWLPFCAFIVASTLFVVNFVVVTVIQGIVPQCYQSHHPYDLTPTESSKIIETARRLETKVDQLSAIVEAMRQKQKHIESLVSAASATATGTTTGTATRTKTGSQTASTNSRISSDNGTQPTAPAARMHSFEDSSNLRADDRKLE